MQAIQVNNYSQCPIYTQIPLPPSPPPSHTQISVITAGLHNVVRSRASGAHYSSLPPPHTPGIDGVGHLLPTNNNDNDSSNHPLVYFHTLLSPSDGSFKQRVNVHNSSITPLPPSLSPIKAAALMNPTISSYMALKTRLPKPSPLSSTSSSNQPPRQLKVLILGITSTSGRLALPTALHLGATHVIGAARSPLPSSLPSSLSAYITLSNTPESTDFSPAADADIVLDYLWGSWPSVYLSSPAVAAVKKPLTWITIGTMAGPNASIPGAPLRSRDITIRGAGHGSWSLADMDGVAVADMLDIINKCDISGEEIKALPAKDVDAAWEYKGKERVVLNF